jgi:hypothetical protein
MTGAAAPAIRNPSRRAAAGGDLSDLETLDVVAGHAGAHVIDKGVQPVLAIGDLQAVLAELDSAQTGGALRLGLARSHGEPRPDRQARPGARAVRKVVEGHARGRDQDLAEVVPRSLLHNCGRLRRRMADRGRMAGCRWRRGCRGCCYEACRDQRGTGQPGCQHEPAGNECGHGEHRSTALRSAAPETPGHADTWPRRQNGRPAGPVHAGKLSAVLFASVTI